MRTTFVILCGTNWILKDGSVTVSLVDFCAFLASRNKIWNHHYASLYSRLTFPAIILQKNPLFFTNPNHKMASAKAITDFFPPAKRSKVVAAAASSLESSSKKSILSVSQKPTTNAVPFPSTTPESVDGSGVQLSPSSNLNEEQKLRVQFNQSLAKAKRNLKICAGRVSKSTSGKFLDMDFPNSDSINRLCTLYMKSREYLLLPLTRKQKCTVTSMVQWISMLMICLSYVFLNA